MTAPLNAQGIVIWEGLSLNPKQPLPIVVIATGFEVDSDNRKTGPMLQVYILLRDMSPTEALKRNLDDAICGDCILRAQTDNGGGRACYVQMVTGGIETVWSTYRRGGYKDVRDFNLIPEAQEIRIGAYGDPAMVPTAVWRRLLTRARMWTCYTHQFLQPWCDQELRHVSMASADDPETFDKADALGWRAFSTKLPSEPLRKGEVWCLYEPYSSAAKKYGENKDSKPQCIDCGLCDGLAHPRAKHIAVKSHGPGAAWYVAARTPLNKRAQLRLNIF